MKLSSSFALAVGLVMSCAEGVLGGSRLWEAQAPNPRTNPDPVYTGTLDSTSALAKRAMSIDVHTSNRMNRRWPDKKIRYCFDNEDTRIKGLFELARRSWHELEDLHGFTYEKVNDRTCERERSTVLRVYYNSQGRLATSLGIPPTGPNMEGPNMHLSDMEGIGQDNIQANVAHELGHSWGLLHGHQNRKWWTKSAEHFGDPRWGSEFTPTEVHFETNKFNCAALKDYEAAARDARAAAQSDPTNHGADPDLICMSRQVAQDYSFSAADWLPWAKVSEFKSDPTFDPRSLMLYPSRAGGIGSGDNRQIVMRYANDELIPNRETPSPMDIQRLVDLYGSSSRSPGEVLNTGGLKSRFNRLREKFSSRNLRAGDTAQGLC